MPTIGSLWSGIGLEVAKAYKRPDHSKAFQKPWFLEHAQTSPIGASKTPFQTEHLLKAFASPVLSDIRAERSIRQIGLLPVVRCISRERPLWLNRSAPLPQRQDSVQKGRLSWQSTRRMDCHAIRPHRVNEISSLILSLHTKMSFFAN